MTVASAPLQLTVSSVKVTPSLSRITMLYDVMVELPSYGTTHWILTLSPSIEVVGA